MPTAHYQQVTTAGHETLHSPLMPHSDSASLNSTINRKHPPMCEMLTITIYKNNSVHLLRWCFLYCRPKPCRISCMSRKKCRHLQHDGLLISSYAGMTSLTYRAVFLVYTACRPYAWQIRRRRTHCAYTQQADIRHYEQARASSQTIKAR